MVRESVSHQCGQGSNLELGDAIRAIRGLILLLILFLAPGSESFSPLLKYQALYVDHCCC